MPAKALQAHWRHDGKRDVDLKKPKSSTQWRGSQLMHELWNSFKPSPQTSGADSHQHQTLVHEHIV